MRLPSQVILDKTNKAIQSFNNRDFQAVHSDIKGVLDTFQIPSFDSVQAISTLKSLRVIASQIKAVDLVLVIDSFLQSFIGFGIPQKSARRDRQIREKTNQIVETWNKGNHAKAKVLLNEWVSLCRTDPVISFDQADCFLPLLNIARAMGSLSIFEDLSSLRKSVTAQSAIMQSNKDMISFVDLDAIDYPRTVTIETFMKCNARCTFCPYPDMAITSQRAGQYMTEELFEKIINDLGDIPIDWPFEMNLSRVNEPLLDHRLFDFITLIEKKLPQVGVFIPSNGSTLTDKNIHRLAGLRNFQKLMISMNSHEKDEYGRTMGLSFDRTVANLDRLHAMKQAGEIPFAVLLTAVIPDGPKLNTFRQWCNERYPLFNCDNYPPTNWFGKTDNMNVDNITMPSVCKDWYQLHILADGSEAQCCYDADGKYGHGNIADMHALEIYNKDWQRKLRRYGSVRQSEMAPDFCRSCTYG